MSNINMRNDYRCIGRVEDNPVICNNDDGTKTVNLTVLAQQNYKNKATGQYDAVRVHLQQFISADRVKTNGTGVFGLIGKGDLVSVAAHIENIEHTDELGEIHVEDILVIDDVLMLESKAVIDHMVGMNDAAKRNE